MKVNETAYQENSYQPWQIKHCYGDNVHLIAEPFLLTQLADLCSPDTVQPRVNSLIEQCYRSLFVRVFNNELPRILRTSDTRMIGSCPEGRFHGSCIDTRTKVVSVNIARGGTLPSHVGYQMLNNLLDPAGVRQDHLVLERTTDAHGKVTGASLDGSKIGGSVEGRILFFPDPMAATGSSLKKAIRHYLENAGGRPSRIIAIHLIVTPEYLRAVHADFPEIKIYAIRVDRGLSPPEVLARVPGSEWQEERGLDDKQYIIPGGGGLGEVLNNAEH